MNWLGGLAGPKALMLASYLAEARLEKGCPSLTSSQVRKAFGIKP